jgi:hypothetical protein
MRSFRKPRAGNFKISGPISSKKSGPSNHHIIPMHQRRAALIAQNRLDLARPVPGDLAGLRRRIAHQALAQHPPSGDRIATGSPRPKLPETLVTPAGSRLFPARRAVTAPASSTSSPLGFIALIQRLRATCGSAAGTNQVRFAPSASAFRGRNTDPSMIAMAQPPGDGGLGGQKLGLHPALRHARNRIAGHRLDLGRDRLDHVKPGGAGVFLGVGGVKSVDIGQQHS